MFLFGVGGMSATAANARRGAGALQAGFLVEAFLSYAGLALLIGLFTLGTLVTSRMLDRPFDGGMAGPLSQLYSVLMPVFLALLLIVTFIRMAAIEKPERPLKHLGGKILRFVADPERLLGMVIMSVLVVIFLIDFAFMKDAIPVLNPFGWDQAFHRMDRMLLGGTDAWRLTFAVFGTPLATTAINALYHCWVFVIYMFLLAAVCGLLDKRLKLSFLYAFMLTWIFGGVVLATMLSSAGPVYFARLGLGDDFEPLMATLRQFNETSPVWSLTVQEMLWASYASQEGIISGISAMPSMHVASTVIVTLLAYRINRRLGHAMLAFTAAIAVGSVHLGWHYAVDGILGAAVALASWHVAGWLAGADLAIQRRLRAAISRG